MKVWESEYREQAATFGTSLTVYNDITSTDIYTLFTGEELPIHFRTGPNPCGAPTELKRFRCVEFHGPNQEGTLRVRIYIDGRYVCDGRAVVSDQPNRHRKVNIPVRRCVGYSIDIEAAGYIHPRAIEVHFDPYEGDAQ